MNNTKQKFNINIYTNDELKTLASSFQGKDYIICSDVFKRESVKEFENELEEITYFNDLSYTISNNSPLYITTVTVPRGRQVLPYVLSFTVAKPMPALHSSIFIIETEEMRGKYAPEWHKDRQPDGIPGNEYHFPLDVFFAFYFEDIDNNHRPTQIIPGSHRDATPLSNTEALVESIHLQMEDVLLTDQRAWHRGVSGKDPDPRFVFVYGMYAMVQHYGTTFQMNNIPFKYGY